MSTVGMLTTRRKRASGRFRMELVAFRLANQIFGVEIAQVEAIIKIPPMTLVPRAPDFVLGVVAARGRVLTVVDVRSRLRLPTPAATRQSRVLLVPSSTKDLVAVYVDEVLQVVRLLETEIELASCGLGFDSTEHVVGVGRQDGNLIVLLNLGPLLG